MSGLAADQTVLLTLDGGAPEPFGAGAFTFAARVEPGERYRFGWRRSLRACAAR